MSKFSVRLIADISFNLLRPMLFFIEFNTVKSGWSIVYNEGLQVVI